MGQIILQTSDWPVAIVSPHGVVSDEQLSKFFVDYSAMLQGKLESYAIIIDLRRASEMPAKQRKLLTDYMKQQEAVVGRHCAGTVLVFDSPVMRAILTAIFWVRNPPQEVHVAGNLADATNWAHGALQRKRRTG